MTATKRIFILGIITSIIGLSECHKKDDTPSPTTSTGTTASNTGNISSTTSGSSTSNTNGASTSTSTGNTTVTTSGSSTNSGSSTSNTGSNTSSNIGSSTSGTPSSASGTLTFQGSTYTMSGGCSTISNSYDIGATSSSYDIAIEFPNGQPTSSTTISFPSSEIQITNSMQSSVWSPVSGSASVTVNQSGVTVSFNSATFSNGQTIAQATASISCK